MYELKVTGASDDLIEIDGAIREEFNAYSAGREEVTHYLVVDGGALLSIRYDAEGIWRVAVIDSAGMTVEKVEGSPVEETFDVVTLRSEAPIRWIVLGRHLKIEGR